MLAGVAGQAVAAPLLQEADHRRVAAGRLPQEGLPQRAVGRLRRCDRRLAGDAVVGVGRAPETVAEVDGDAGAAQQPGVRVPGRLRHRVQRVGPRHPLDAAGKARPPRRLQLVLVAFPPTFARKLPAVGKGAVGGIELPMVAVPLVPLPGVVVEPHASAMPHGEGSGDAVFSDLDVDRLVGRAFWNSSRALMLPPRSPWRRRSSRPVPAAA